MEPEVEPQALLTALTTEHFTLQGARASTVSESTARAAIYVGAVSSALVALGLIGQAADLGSAFDVFVLVVLPTLYALGTFTFVRLVDFTLATMVSVLTAVVGGAAVAFLIGVLGGPLGIDAGIGGVVAMASMVLNARWQRGVHADARESGEVLFPSPGGA